MSAQTKRTESREYVVDAIWSVQELNKLLLERRQRRDLPVNSQDEVVLRLLEMFTTQLLLKLTKYRKWYGF